VELERALTIELSINRGKKELTGNQTGNHLQERKARLIRGLSLELVIDRGKAVAYTVKFYLHNS